MIRFESSLPGITWPAVPSNATSRLLAILFQLEQSQWWTASRIRQCQESQLSLALDHANATVPYYRGRLGAIPRVNALTATEEWLRFPLLTRRDIQTAGERLYSENVPAEHGAICRQFTGGSTGEPVLTLATSLSMLFWHTLTLRDHLWHKRDFSQSLGVIRHTTSKDTHPPDGKIIDNWGSSTRNLVRTGNCMMLSIQSTVDEQIHWLDTYRPNYLLTYPSCVDALARKSEQTGIRLDGLRHVRTFGEVLEPHVRDRCRTAWNVDITDVYSTQEVGYIAIQCPTNDQYHVQSDNILLEVLKDDGTPCTSGEMGRVVLTTLHNFAMPLIRYEIGDYAEVGSPCMCGRGLPVLKRILGRQRNILVLPNGQQIWPSFELDSGGNDIAMFRGVRQMQLVQRTATDIDVNLVVEQPLHEDLIALLNKHIISVLGYPFQIKLNYMNSIPRSPTGKYEDFRSEVRVDSNSPCLVGAEVEGIS